MSFVIVLEYESLYVVEPCRIDNRSLVFTKESRLLSQIQSEI